MVVSALTATISLIALVSGSKAAASTSCGPAARPYICTSSADMFWCTSKQMMCATQTVTRNISYGTPLRMVCWRDDRDPFNPNGTSRWFYSVMDNGQEGYLWAPQVGGQVRTPACSTVNWINVSDWAIGRNNGSFTQWRSTSLDGPFIPNRQGSYWSGWCLSFASDAWYMAGGAPTSAFSYPSAIAMWNAYAAQGRVDTTHRPPRGAMVFWNWTSDGHVAISLGNWRVVSTQGNWPQTLPIYDFSFGPSNGYLGWIMPVSASVPQNL